jgi:hypothetical protein
MAICNALTAGLAKSCETNAGGVNKIFITDFVSLSPTISGGEITGITPTGPNAVVTTAATVNTTTSGFVRILVSVTIPGDQTSVFTTGKWIYFTYNVMQIDGVTVTATSWSGYVLSSSYNAGTNTTTIVPDFLGFTPLIGQSSDPAPPNTNQTVSTFMFFEFQTNKNVCNFTESVAVDTNNGTTFFNQVVSIVLTRRETTKRNAILKLVDSQKQLLLVVLDSNSNYWLFGLREGSYVTAIEGGSGTAKSDINGYTITFTAMEPIQAYEIAPAAIAPYLFPIL